MKTIMLTVFALLSLCAQSQCRLDIEINGIRNNKGNIMLQLLGTDERAVKQEIIPAKEKSVTIILNDIKAGRYAIRYYHDENVSGKMETNLVGKPVEGYGFSNNVTGKFGPPPFEKWLFDVSGNKKIILSINY
jgi:uncharacterized protein (DUF2141 family)